MSSSSSRASFQVGKDNVNLALSLVGYDKEVSAAMQYVFGSTLICKTLEQAKQVTFNDKIRSRSVTLDGDVYDPAGTLTGGAQTSSTTTLVQLQELRESRAELEQIQARLAIVIDSLTKITKVAVQYTKLKAQYELKAHEAELAAERIAQGSVHQVSLEDCRHFICSRGCYPCYKTDLEWYPASLLISSSCFVNIAPFLNMQAFAEITTLEAALEQTKTGYTAAQAREKNANKKIVELETSIKNFASEVRP